MEWIAGLPHVQPRQRAPGPPDRLESAVFAIAQHAEILEGFLDEFLGFLERFAGDVLERKPAKGQCNAAAHTRAMHVKKLERAAPQGRDNAVRVMNPGHDSKRGKMGLAPSREN